uniref:Uncharacterized protein n=1 Tax=Arundo donax TaxID=35708 RepID=A0A0A9D496_ARUDO
MLLNFTCANLLFAYPNQLLYFLFPDLKFISSASTKPTVCIIELTLTILLGEPRRREGISNIASNAGARWFTCMCSSWPSFEKR